MPYSKSIGEHTLKKLSDLCSKIDLKSEGDLVYLFVLIRKIIEDEGRKNPRLNFYCDWILHNTLTRSRSTATLALPNFPKILTELTELKDEIVAFAKELRIISLKKLIQENWKIFLNAFLIVNMEEFRSVILHLI